MAKYRKKPVVIDAVLYVGGTESEGIEDGFACFENDTMPPPCHRFVCQDCPCWHPYLNTLEGRAIITPGDYVITGVKGERYPCKPDIFALTYEPVEVPVKRPFTESERELIERGIPIGNGWYI